MRLGNEGGGGWGMRVEEAGNEVGEAGNEVGEAEGG